MTHADIDTILSDHQDPVRQVQRLLAVSDPAALAPHLLRLIVKARGYERIECAVSSRADARYPGVSDFLAGDVEDIVRETNKRLESIR